MSNELLKYISFIRKHLYNDYKVIFRESGGPFQYPLHFRVLNEAIYWRDRQ